MTIPINRQGVPIQLSKPKEQLISDFVTKIISYKPIEPFSVTELTDKLGLNDLEIKEFKALSWNIKQALLRTKYVSRYGSRKLMFKDINENENLTLNYIISNNITNEGFGNIINTGDDVNIHARINIRKGSKIELEKFLRENKLLQKEIAQLLEIIDEDKPDLNKKKFGVKVNDWIKIMLGKALDGTWNVAIGAAGGILATAIGRYYGFVV